jgi:hypothetical protein
MLGFCDALFLRHADTIADRPVQLAQLAFLSLYFEQLAYGFHVLDRLRATGFDEAAGARTYGGFLRAIEEARRLMPVLYPPTFVDLFPTYEESVTRFDARTTEDELSARAVERYTAVQQRLVRSGEAIEKLAVRADLPIEAVFRGYGMPKQADAIKARRLADLTDMLAEFNITINRPDAPA